MIELIQPTPGFRLNPEVDCTTIPDGSSGPGTSESDLHNTHLANWRTALKMGYPVVNLPHLHHYPESITPAVGTRDKYPVEPREFSVETHFSMRSLAPLGIGQYPIEKMMVDIDFRLNNIRTAVDLRVFFRGRIAVELKHIRGTFTLYAAREYRDPALPYIGEEAVTVPGNLPGGVADFHRCLAVTLPQGSLAYPGEILNATLTIKYYDFLRGIDPADGPFINLSDTNQANGLDWLGIKRAYVHHFVDIA